jgi:hypothetical protein
LTTARFAIEDDVTDRDSLDAVAPLARREGRPTSSRRCMLS